MSDGLNISWRRVYAYAVCAIVFMRFFKGEYNTGIEYLDIFITLVCLIGVICHVNHIRIFHQRFWQVWVPLALSWDLWTRISDWSSQSLNLALIKQIIPDFLMYMGPVYFFLFGYAFIHFPLKSEAVDDYD